MIAIDYGACEHADFSEIARLIASAQARAVQAVNTTLIDLYWQVGHDPYGDPAEALHEYGVQLLSWAALPQADAIVAAVSHHQFVGISVADFQQKLIKGGCFIDVKACFDAKAFEEVGIKVWRL